MTLNLEQKTKIRDTNYSKLVLVMQTLFHEEIIKKNTYDSLYSLLNTMDKNNPTVHDFIGDLFLTSEKTQIMSNVAAQLDDAWVRLIEFNGKKYQLQLKELK